MGTSICISCRGAKLLCGKPVCPIIIRAQALSRVKSLSLKEVVEGSTPPSFFVGRAGYPRVYAGPMVPPIKGDTSIYAMPEAWSDKGFEDIISMRSMLIRGKRRVDVMDARDPSPYLNELHDAALSSGPVDAEMLMERPPSTSLSLSEEAPPFGPSAPIKRVTFSPHKSEEKVEKVYYDIHLNSREAILQLYYSEVPVSRIAEVLSLGMLGVKKNRKLVPTRWSITAVDETISEFLVSKVRGYEFIDEIRVFAHDKLGSRYVTMLLPGRWSFEWIESWFPGTTWNMKGVEPAIMGDHEGFRGRSTYPDIGGCYYASRLALTEYLDRERRQAKAVLIREIYKDYLLPLGVWMVREALRECYRNRPTIFSEIREAVEYIRKLLKVPIERYISMSAILKEALRQERLDLHLR